MNEVLTVLERWEVHVIKLNVVTQLQDWKLLVGGEELEKIPESSFV